MIMRTWTLTWNAHTPRPGLYLRAAVLFSSVCAVGGGCSPEQLAAVTNCSRSDRHSRNYDYLEGGDVRIRQLFSGTQWFLTVDDSGNITGTQDPTDCYSKEGGGGKRHEFPVEMNPNRVGTGRNAARDVLFQVVTRGGDVRLCDCCSGSWTRVPKSKR